MFAVDRRESSDSLRQFYTDDEDLVHGKSIPYSGILAYEDLTMQGILKKELLDLFIENCHVFTPLSLVIIYNLVPMFT